MADNEVAAKPAPAPVTHPLEPLRLNHTEMEAARAYVQGIAFAAIHTFARETAAQPTRLVQPTDDDGALLPYFELYLATNLVLRFDVSVVDRP